MIYAFFHSFCQLFSKPLISLDAGLKISLDRFWHSLSTSAKVVPIFPLLSVSVLLPFIYPYG